MESKPFRPPAFPQAALFGSVLEIALVGVAFLVASLLSVSPLGGWQWNWKSVGIGVVGALPPLVFFVFTLRTMWPPLVRVRDFLEKSVRPLLQNSKIWELAVISLFAGIGEEMLFRAAIQGGLESFLGVEGALLLASVLFGVAHWITKTYVVVATVIGLYLGGLWLWTGNLLVPIVTHAVYDFVALVVFLRFHGEPKRISYRKTR